ncbi:MULTISPECIES: Ger(x)C family spore germination protein [Bacillus]|uniref:Ger(x)C family spore germination protein n=1 Tax=Bacillus TaxID=1386 RepID=UPI000BB972AA|nr:MULTISPECIES: Ger(x)C family spore germination protein [Bacillus]
MKTISKLFIISFLLTGCINQEILDDVQLVTAVGYDLTEEGLIEATAVFPSYSPDKLVKNNALTESAKLSKDIRDKIDRMSPKPLVSGKIEVALFSEAIAKQGIINILDTFIRDPTTGARMYLAVVEGDVENKLNKQYSDIDNGMFFSDLIEHNIDLGIIPRTNLQIFTKSYYAEGRDPVLPFLTLQSNKAFIEGIALFKEDKYVGKLQGEFNYIFKMLYEKNVNYTVVTVDLENDGSSTSVINVSSKRELKIKDALTNPIIQLKVTTDSIIREYSGGELDKDLIKEIEKKMEEQIKLEAEQMIAFFQKLEIDPLGIGYKVKHQHRNWDKEKWNQLYPNASVEIEVDVIINETGVIN